jgi:hypothetical protein
MRYKNFLDMLTPPEWFEQHERSRQEKVASMQREAYEVKHREWEKQRRRYSTYTYTYILIHIHTHTHTFTYILIHTYTYSYIHIHTYTYIHILIQAGREAPQGGRGQARSSRRA